MRDGAIKQSTQEHLRCSTKSVITFLFVKIHKHISRILSTKLINSKKVSCILQKIIRWTTALFLYYMFVISHIIYYFKKQTQFAYLWKIVIKTQQCLRCKFHRYFPTFYFYLMFFFLYFFLLTMIQRWQLSAHYFLLKRSKQHGSYIEEEIRMRIK